MQIEDCDNQDFMTPLWRVMHFLSPIHFPYNQPYIFPKIGYCPAYIKIDSHDGSTHKVRVKTHVCKHKEKSHKLLNSTIIPNFLDRVTYKTWEGITMPKCQSPKVLDRTVATEYQAKTNHKLGDISHKLVDSILVSKSKDTISHKQWDTVFLKGQDTLPTWGNIVPQYQDRIVQKAQYTTVIRCFPSISKHPGFIMALLCFDETIER